ncbi:MAG TPA: glycosyltransferase [Thermoleophilaceae bacterium]|nr:glycosyltransferase [Thermoleophilaceae bacterium]
MNVCVVAEYYPRRRDPALGVWAHQQARAARDAGADVRVLVLERPVPPARALRSAGALGRSLRALATQPRREERDGIAVECVRFLAPPRERSYARWGGWAREPTERALDRLERDRPIDVVHAHYAIPAGAAVRGWAAARGKPLVVSVHGGDVFAPLLATPDGRGAVASVLRSARVVLCNGRETLQRVEALAAPAVNARVVHLGAAAPAPLPEKHTRPAVATLAHVVARKRHEDVLRALADERLAGVDWVVIGDGPERATLAGLASELGVEGRIRWMGALDHPQALAELARCHVMALPSVDEAFGVAYVEALACGVPVVATRGEGGPEEIAALVPGVTLVPPRAPRAVADALAELLADRGALERLGRAAGDAAGSLFDWRRTGELTVAAYRDALGQPC